MILDSNQSSFDEKISHFFDFELTGELITSLMVMLILIIISLIIFIKCKHVDPLKRPKGLLLLAEWFVEKLDHFVEENMGADFEGWGGYFLAIASYVFLAFIFGLTGLPSPMTSLIVPLSLSTIMFFLIHATSVRYTKWKYFKRYIEPVALFLPINLLSMWSPLISTSLRLFGNAIAGYVLMGILYWALENASAAVFSFLPEGVNSIFFAPLVTPILHCYFDLFSGFVQTLVFCTLSSLFIAQEKPDQDLEEQVSVAHRENIEVGKEV
jgi:F-type H+-transporting ATPase subunit a